MNTLPTQISPWWRHGHVWLVISGPALVVAAGIVTVFLAINYPDAVIIGQKPARASRTGEPRPSRALAPAREGRTPAATPDKAARP